MRRSHPSSLASVIREICAIRGLPLNLRFLGSAECVISEALVNWESVVPFCNSCTPELLPPNSGRLLMMDDRSNRCCPVASQLFVLKKCELHPAATEKVARLECMRKTKAAPRNPDVAGGSIRARASQTRFVMIDYGKKIIRVFRDDPKNISGIELTESKFFGVRFPIAISELLPV